jgi:hypothetical protein
MAGTITAATIAVCATTRCNTANQQPRSKRVETLIEPLFRVYELLR